MRISYLVHGVRFSIDAAGRVAAELSGAVMPPCVRKGCGARDGETTFVVRDEGAGFAVLRGRKLLWHAGSEAELIPWLEAEIVNWLLGQFRRHVQIHAAVVERRGRAVLIAGGPDAGKTSLACALGLAGWGVMTDEVALVEPRGSTVSSFPRAMLVKTGTARRLPELQHFQPRRVMLDEGLEPVRYVSPGSVGGKVKAKAKIAALAFPEWSRKPSVEALGEREALERLVQASFNMDRRPRLLVDTCVGLVRGARLLRVKVGALRESARALAEAMGAKR